MSFVVAAVVNAWRLGVCIIALHEKRALRGAPLEPAVAYRRRR
jgi:hypothetical protein